MNPSNFSIELDARLDKNDKIYFLGKKKFPGYIDLSQGLTLLAFVSEDGDEEIQIAVNDKENSTFSKVKRDKVTSTSDGRKSFEDKVRLKIPMESRKDQFDQVFYVCKVNTNLIINCFKEVTFLLYTSKKGQEQIQIVGHMEETDDDQEEGNINSNIEIFKMNRRRD